MPVTIKAAQHYTAVSIRAEAILKGLIRARSESLHVTPGRAPLPFARAERDIRPRALLHKHDDRYDREEA